MPPPTPPWKKPWELYINPRNISTHLGVLHLRILAAAAVSAAVVHVNALNMPVEYHVNYAWSQVSQIGQHLNKLIYRRSGNFHVKIFCRSMILQHSACMYFNLLLQAWRGNPNLHLVMKVLPHLRLRLQYALHLCIWYLVTKLCKLGSLFTSGMR